jgi:BASS family bile acid:Na+ symporter
MEFLQSTFTPLVFIFTVSNLAAMGLQVSLPEVMAALKNRAAIVLIFVWGWILGPALGYLITLLLPLEEPYKIVILLASLAPCAPFLQQMVGKASGDISFAGALIPLVAVGTVILMPVMAPFLIKGLTINAMALAKPLLLTILLPLLIGAAIRHYYGTTATRVYPAVKVLAKLSTLLTVLWCLILFGKDMLNTAGQFALMAMTLFMVGMALVTYLIGFGMRQSHGAGYGHAQCCRRVGGGSRHSRRGPAHTGDDRHVDFVVRRSRRHRCPDLCTASRKID